MAINLLEQARVYRDQMILNEIASRKSLFPGGSTGELLIAHSNRVEMLINDIQAKINHHIDPIELSLAAIFHDIGKSIRYDNHALYSAELTEKWLNEHSNLTNDSKNRIISNIRVHSDKSSDVTLDKQILQDADELDEIGAMSIIMHVHNNDKNDKEYFDKLIGILEKRELVICRDVISKLKTEVAREMMNQKIIFIETFIKQLKAELYC